MGTRNIPLGEAGPTVEDVMLRAPRTVAPDTTVGEARATFENPRVRLLLVADGDRFLGVVQRDAIPDDAADDAPLGGLTGESDRVAPEDPVDRAMALLDADGGDRLPVVAGDGAIVGLICFNRRHGHFCVDG